MISEAYRELNARMHREKPQYGCVGRHFAEEVAKLCRLNCFSSVLDYGCGKGTLKSSLPSEVADMVREYDPAIPGKDHAPDPADMVVCTDVLEHVEPEYLDVTLDHLKRLARRAIFINAALGAAEKTLPDGRNAHLIVKPVEWWRERIRERFSIVRESTHPAFVTFLAVPHD